MTATNINAKPVRIGAAGGRLLIKVSSTNYNILNLRPGSEYAWEPGLTGILHETSNGILTTPQNGDQRPTKLSVRAQYTANVGANELQTRLLTTDNTSPDGYRLQFDVYLEIFDNKDATTCTTIRFQKCTVDEGFPKIRAGSKFDEIDIDFTDWESKPTVSAAATPLA